MEMYVPMAKKQSIPTTRKIFSIIEGLELASMHLNNGIQKNNAMKTIIAKPEKTFPSFAINK